MNTTECAQKALKRKQRMIEAAMGRSPADLVLKNAEYVNVFSGRLCRGDIAVAEGYIVGIGEYHGTQEFDVSGKIVCPGLIDGHIHLESSLVSPAEFAKAVVPHGTTTVVVDPHEIANVMGADGIAYIVQASDGPPLDVRLMLPSCVPATPLDESGAVLDSAAIEPLYDVPRVLGLAEMMNHVGVIMGDPDVLGKLVSAQAHGGQIDGHAPGLHGTELNAYIAAGIASDHECTNAEEAIEKLEKGQYILIREGTAAKNLDALLPLLTPRYASRCVFATDDKHPTDLLSLGHIDYIVRRAIAGGADPIIAVQVATHNAAQYFGMRDRGAIAPGLLADMIVVDDLRSFRVEQVFRHGMRCSRNGVLYPFPAPHPDEALLRRALDTFHLPTLTEAMLVPDRPLGVIGMIPGEIVTTDEGLAAQPDPDADLLKMAVLERHRGTGHVGLGFLKGYGLKRGAVATSIAHDSHNLIAVGTNDRDIAAAANQVAAQRGGIAVVEDGKVVASVVLELAGLMTDRPLAVVSEELENAVAAARARGVRPGVDPFMTLSFMSLPVIPTLRLTTQGIFNVPQWRYL